MSDKLEVVKMEVIVQDGNSLAHFRLGFDDSVGINFRVPMGVDRKEVIRILQELIAVLNEESLP